MSKTYKFSVADGIKHRHLNVTEKSRNFNRPVKKLVHHRARQTASREIGQEVQCSSLLDCQCPGCVEFWNRIHAATEVCA